MSARGSERGTFNADTNEKTILHKQNSTKRASGVKTRFTSSCRLRVPRRSELSPMRFLKRLGDKVAAALHFASRRRRPSHNVSSSGRSNPSIAPIDSHRAEAISDCIEFINSSASLGRSNSVPTSSC